MQETRWKSRVGKRHWGDALAVPAGTVHSAEVLGDEPVVSLDAVRI